MDEDYFRHLQPILRIAPSTELPPTLAPHPPVPSFCRRLVLPGAHAVVEFPITASRVGSHWLLVSLHCDQATDIRGWAKITVVAPTRQSESGRQSHAL